ncbi:plasmid mobilization protein [Flavobacterium cerinum]|uniref:Plasmid mobilization relaxosome protein MobC n=1 Tax=Flavobacterium cerinum TaxID=2502784 RepID=A0ABY5IN41_9FLAO|nr:plasmid mobilization relaxosome protein MobC [Flavobacterium cerinum]UUC44169.1 plasmid mobilization relaxosome protein MobC [Flavobacterium cerinum]
MEEQTKTKWLHIRLSEQENLIIQGHFKASTCRKLSEYCRTKLLDRPIIKSYRDRSLDDFMTEMIALRFELNRIANNYNQSVKKLHTLSTITDFRTWLMAYDIEKNTLFNKMEEIRTIIQKFAERWLQ